MKKVFVMLVNTGTFLERVNNKIVSLRNRLNQYLGVKISNGHNILKAFICMKLSANKGLKYLI